MHGRSPTRTHRRQRRARAADCVEALEARTLLAALPAPPPETQVNTFTRDHQRHPSVAADADGDYVVTWQSYQQEELDWNIFAQRYASNGVPQGPEFRVNQNTGTYNTVPSVAMDSDGDFVVAWTQGPAGNVMARRFAADGAPRDDEFVVDWTQRAGTASVAMDAQGGFVVVWDIAAEADDRRSVFGQKYYWNGNRQGVFQISTNLTGSAGKPDVAMDADGDFVVAFEVADDPLLVGTYVRRYDKSGTALLPESRVSTSAGSDAPAVATTDAGSYVVTWSTSGGIYARSFSPDGLPHDLDILVGAVPASQGLDVSTDATGNFVVTWSALGAAGGNTDVYARGFMTNGGAVASQFKINSYVSSQQTSPAVVMTDDGGFVATWSSWGQDGDMTGVFARRFENTYPPAAAVVGRRVFYNRSAFDGNNAFPGAADDAAIATNKVALLPGGTASFLNVTSYTRGINGVMVDVAELPAGVTLNGGDFTFRSGATSDRADWSAGPAPVLVTTRLVAPGRHRVTLVWRDHNPNDESSLSQAVANGWLEVTLKASEKTNLLADDVFYFGNLIGETGGTNAAGELGVNAFDAGRVRAAQRSSAASISNLYDFNRDGRVNVVDLGVARSRDQVTLPLMMVPRLETITIASLPGPTSRLRGHYLDPMQT